MCLFVAVLMVASVLPTSLAVELHDSNADSQEPDRRTTITRISGPFAAMYDSDAVFSELAEPIILAAQMEEVDAAKATQRGELDSETPVSERRALQHDVADTLDAHLDTVAVDALAFEGHTAEALEQLYEDTRVQQYIVKYQSSEARGKVASAVGIQKSAWITESDALYEVITLAERSNPAELAQAMMRSGIDGGDIEYIQPDFLMSFAGFGLSYEDVTETVNSLPSTDVIQDPVDDGELDLPSGDDSGDSKDDGDSPSSDDFDDSQEEDEVTDDASEDDELIPADEENAEPIETIVALIDTGVDCAHPALQGKMIDGWDFTIGTTWPYDEVGHAEDTHGTHIAGIIAANSGSGVTIMPLKVFGEYGAYTSDIIAAIAFAEAYGAQIANLSFGSGHYNPALEAAIAASSMLFVASAGNAREDLAVSPVYPAAFDLPNLVSVASLNADGGFSYYSNYSNTVIDIGARGRNVESALPGGGVGLQSGTSMAAGFVSAAAGWVHSSDSDLTAVDLKERLLSTADQVNHLMDKIAGGRSLNAGNAYWNSISEGVQTWSVEEDFDVNGYAPTPSENWELFSVQRIVDIAAGDNHTLALSSNGTVWAWGTNDSGQLGDGTTLVRSSPVQVIGLSNIVSISAATSHSVAVRADGTAWAWGSNSSGRLGDGTSTTRYIPVQVSGLSNISMVAIGDTHSLAVDTSGDVWAWGSNSSGQLGDGTTTTRYTPVQVSGLNNISMLSAGSSHSVAVNQTGAVYAWGNNSSGNVGDGTTTSRSAPTQVSGLSGVEIIAAGDNHTLALKDDGSVWAWGNNSSGRLGDGTSTTRYTPVQALYLTDAVAISAGGSHSLAVKADGSMWAWGANTNGRLGDGTTTTRTSPTKINGMTGVVLVAAGYSHSAGLKSDGAVWTWGSNSYGQLGDDVVIHRSAPTAIEGYTDIIQVSAGTIHSLALSDTGIAWAWGSNGSGRLGDGSSTTRYTPVQVSGLTNLIEVSAGGSHSLAVRDDGTVWAWGYNYYGQLGDGTTIARTSPVQVTGLTDVISVSAGTSHSLALKTDGTVWAWGYNSYGRLGDGTTTNSSAPVKVDGLSGVASISAGDAYSLAVKTDGTVWGWGYNTYSQLGDNSTTARYSPVQASEVSNIIAVAAGTSHSLAIKDDGTLWSWGSNGNGRLGDGTTTTRRIPTQITSMENMVSVAAGSSNSLAVKDDGSIWAWGYNVYDQLGDGSTTTFSTPQQIAGPGDALHVSTGGTHSLAASSAGDVYSWGSNDSDQLGVQKLTESKVPVKIKQYGTIAQIHFSEDEYIFYRDGDLTPLQLSVSGIMVDGDNYEGLDVAYQLVGTYEGVTVDSATGLVTVAENVALGQTTISAIYEEETATATLTIAQSPYIAFDCSSYAVIYNEFEAQSETVSATVYDLLANVDAEAEIVYGLAEVYAGISIDTQTGEVSVSPTAATGAITVTASSGELQVEVSLRVLKGDMLPGQLEMAVSLNRIYDVFLVAKDIESFANREIVLSFDSDVFELVDLCSYTANAELETGALADMGITITHITDDEIRLIANKDIPDNSVWSGVLTSIRFRAIATTDSIIEIQ